MAIFSPLCDQIKISPNSSNRENNKIKRFTPHCVVGQYSAADVASWKKFNDGKTASANYIIGKSGEILGNVSEDRRAWTSGGTKNVNGRTGKMNDYEAITVECASDASRPWAFNAVVYDNLIKLCVDVCKRNGKNKLIWFNDAAKTEAYATSMPDNEMLLTVHRWYAAAECPGTWLYERLDQFTQQVNTILSDGENKPTELWHVQIGAFSNKANADRLAADLNAKGYNTYIVRY